MHACMHVVSMLKARSPFQSGTSIRGPVSIADRVKSMHLGGCTFTQQKDSPMYWMRRPDAKASGRTGVKNLQLQHQCHLLPHRLCKTQYEEA